MDELVDDLKPFSFTKKVKTKADCEELQKDLSGPGWLGKQKANMVQRPQVESVAHWGNKSQLLLFTDAVWAVGDKPGKGSGGELNDNNVKLQCGSGEKRKFHAIIAYGYSMVQPHLEYYL